MCFESLVIDMFKLLVLKIDCNCIWYGECGESDNVGTGKYNCKYTGKAKPFLNATSQKVLKTECPHLFNGDNTVTCCDDVMVNRLSKDFSLPRQIISRCPACYRNFRTFLCDMTCSPDQDQFLIVTKDRPYNPSGKNVVPSSANVVPSSASDDSAVYDEDEDDDTKSVQKRSPQTKVSDTIMEITEITYTLSEYYANHLFDSCK
jgi:hypothetical protein